jgi:hypothetical protein
MKLGYALLLAFAASSVACSSASFEVSGAPGDDSGTTLDDSATNGETATDTAVDPCAPEDGVAKICVKIAIEGGHPPYDSASGAESLGIDGKGTFFVALFDKDPAIDLGGAAPTPVSLLQYPEVGSDKKEANIDGSVPTLTGRVTKPGTYWVITQFADAKAMRGTGESAVLPGDFVIVPSVDAKTRKAAYPKVTLEAGSTGNVEQKLRAYRRVDVDLTTTAELRSSVAMNGNVHGDGPVFFAVFDGDISSPTLLSVGTAPCVNVHVHDIGGGTAKASFGTTVDGGHNLLAVLFDYKTDLNADGNFFTQTDPKATIHPVPKVNISATSWTSSTSAQFVSVPSPNAPSATITDPFVCGGG